MSNLKIEEAIQIANLKGEKCLKLVKILIAQKGNVEKTYKVWQEDETSSIKPRIYNIKKMLTLVGYKF